MTVEDSEQARSIMEAKLGRTARRGFAQIRMYVQNLCHLYRSPLGALKDRPPRPA